MPNPERDIVSHPLLHLDHLKLKTRQAFRCDHETGRAAYQDKNLVGCIVPFDLRNGICMQVVSVIELSNLPTVADQQRLKSIACMEKGTDFLGVHDVTLPKIGGEYVSLRAKLFRNTASLDDTLATDTLLP